MASVNLKNYGKNNQKKAWRISSGTIVPADLTTGDGVATAGTLASGDVVTICTLPADCAVFNAYIVVKVAPTTGTQTMKISVGGTDVIAAVAVGTTSNAIVGGTVTRKATGTGANVTVTTGVGALTDGEFEVVVCYAEYARTIGEYTN